MNEQQQDLHRLAVNAAVKDDYVLFTNEKRKELIIEYVNLISSIGFKPVKVMASPDETRTISFRAILEFMRPNNGANIVRKHLSFFEARNWSNFSLRNFNNEVIESTDLKTLEDFKKMLKIRIWNIGFTDEEILCAILGRNPKYLISDLIVDGKLIIPPETINGLFWDLNVTGGNNSSQRLIRRKKEGSN